jgi:hypothetical protein
MIGASRFMGIAGDRLLQCFFAGVSEGGMPDIVAEGGGGDPVLDPIGAGHFG